MPAPPRPQNLLAKVARLYYLEDQPQSQIAKALGLSPSTISRMLTAAREQGVVEIRIQQPGMLTRDGKLEVKICERFGIADAYVVVRPTGRTGTDVVAETGARIFEELVTQVNAIGLSWGSTIERFVDHVSVEPISRGLTLCPLVGGMPTLDVGPVGNTSLEILANKCGVTPFRFESPSIVESRETWAALSRESSIVTAIERAAAVPLAFVGVGSYGFHASRSVIAAMRLSEHDLAAVEAQHPAGDICGHFVDIHGRPLGPPASERVIGVTLEQLAAIPHVIALAGGVEKALGMVSALRTGILNTVVLDDELARAVLAVERANQPAPGGNPPSQAGTGSHARGHG